MDILPIIGTDRGNLDDRSVCFLVVGGLLIALSAIFGMLPSSLLPTQSAFATFPGENGKIAFESQRDGNPEIYVMNSDGSNQTRLTFTSSAGETHPNWSPDGAEITFGSNRDNGKFDIYVMDADGSNPTRLTNDPAHDEAPDWGPATEPPEEDITPPVLTVPDDMVVDANSTKGAEVTYTVTAEDNIDGVATLEEDGTTII
jgi:dipeptidyl aminopeptidase/acylaminoacyl peptidase